MESNTLKGKRVVDFIGERYNITRQRGVCVLTPDRLKNRQSLAHCPDCAGKGLFYDGKYTRLCGLCKITVEVRGVDFKKNHQGYVFGTRGRYYDNGFYSIEGIEKAVSAAKEAYKEAKIEGREARELCVVVL